ncbi:MAG: PepSY-associated TM helix domain-containing protein [Myxococcota bacterium]
MTGTALRRWIWIHRWSSLIGMLFMLMLCLTGLPLIFAHELDHVFGNTAEAPELDGIAGRVSIDELTRSAEAQSGGQAVKFLVEDHDDPNVWYFNIGPTVDAAETTEFIGYDARTGSLLSEYPMEGSFVGLMLRLHVDLFAGLYGMLFLGLMGFLMVIAIISGVVIYAPFMRRLRFGEIRASRALRTQWLDIHNLFGIVTTVWLGAVSVTGIINTLSIPVFEAWKATQLAEMTEPYADATPVPAADAQADKAVKAALDASPGMALSFMAYPGNSFASPAHFVAFMRGTTAWTSKFLEPVLIDARSGEVVDRRELPWYTTALLLSQPLHFGDYGGMPLKVLWALLDIMAIFVLGSGLYLWAAKRSRASKPEKEVGSVGVPASEPVPLEKSA